MKKLLAVLVVTLLIVGCGSGRKAYEAGLVSLKGRHVDDFYRVWGPPTSRVDLSDGGYILAWQKSSTHTTGVYNTTTMKPVMLPNGQLMSIPVNETHGGKTKNKFCEVKIEFLPDNIASRVAYQGCPMCAEWFPVPEVK